MHYLKVKDEPIAFSKAKSIVCFIACFMLISLTNSVYAQETIVYPHLEATDATKSASAGSVIELSVKMWASDGVAAGQGKEVTFTILDSETLSSLRFSSSGSDQGDRMLVSTNTSGVATAYYLVGKRKESVNIRVSFMRDDRTFALAGFTVTGTGIITFSSTSTSIDVLDTTSTNTEIGSPITATHIRNTDENVLDPILYSITAGNSDSKFSIDENSGQLKLVGSLDYSDTSTYTLTVEARSLNTAKTKVLADETTSVTINVVYIRFAGSSTTLTRSIQENAGANAAVGSPVTATHSRGDTLTYSIVSGVGQANLFSIDSTGQIKAKNSLDYETMTSTTIRVSAGSGSLSETIDVTISVTDVSEVPSDNSAPSFTDGDSTDRRVVVTDSISSYYYISPNVTATDADDDTLTYSIVSGGHGLIDVGSSTGQLAIAIFSKAWALGKIGSSYNLLVKAQDTYGVSDTITVTVTLVSNSNPVFTSADTSYVIQENNDVGVEVGSVTATDPDGYSVEYTIGGTDASSFSVGSTTGIITASIQFDYETKNSYEITVTATDTHGGSKSITLTINIGNEDESEEKLVPGNPPTKNPPPNNPPVFTDGTSTTRSVAENTPPNTNIGSAVTATDPDGDTVVCSLSGTDAASFSVDGSSGQLKTAAALDYESKNTYSVTITATDAKGLKANIAVTISVTDVNEPVTPPPIQPPPIQPNNPPVFTDGTSTTRSVAENTPANTNIGSAVTATDADTDTLTYTLSGTNAASFSIDSRTGQLKTAASLDYETKNTYSVTITATDQKGLKANIAVTIQVTDVNETVTPPPNQPPPNQPPPNQPPPNQPNNPPVFTDGTSTTRRVAENTPANTNFGSAVTATDPDGDTLTYTLSGTNAASFSIDSSRGQLQTVSALDYETKNTYSVTITAADPRGLKTNIAVTINITDVNETVIPQPDPNPQPDPDPNPQPDPVPQPQPNNPPAFPDGSTTTRTIEENTPPNTNIGSAVTATDPDGDTLTYTLSGPDAASFRIDSSTGQIYTVSALDDETKNAYTVIVYVYDSYGNSSVITVTININDIEETITSPQPNPEAKSNYTIIPFDYKNEGVGKVVFSEIMVSGYKRYPQWIELYNTSDQDIDLKGWKIVGRYMHNTGGFVISKTISILESHVFSQSIPIKGKQTVLIANFETLNTRDRISKGLVEKIYAIGSDTTNYWNYEGIVLELQDPEGTPIDRMGNLNAADEIVWEIPEIVRNERVSLIRRLKSVRSQEYNWTFGMKKFGWFPANEVEMLSQGRCKYYCGRYTDIGSPGYRAEDGELLPVTLSSFSPALNKDGTVIISWATESEIDNAGFNILRSEKLKGPFIRVNPKLIQGAGTTGERNEYAWTDTTAKPGIEYYYQIEDISFAGVKQTLATKRMKVKGVFSVQNRLITHWGDLKTRP